MTKVEWNLYAEGVCEENELPFEFTGANVKQILYLKRKCPVCGEIQWIKYGLNVCDGCIP